MKINKKTIVKTIVAVIVGFVVFIVIYVIVQVILLFRAVTTPAPQIIPCNGNPASKIEIARPGDAHTEFATTGGDIFFMMKNIKDYAVFSYPVATIRIGLTANSPQWGEWNIVQSSSQEFDEKTIFKFSVKAGTYNKINIKEGKYWLYVNAGTNLEILSCTPNGVSNSLPSK